MCGIIGIVSSRYDGLSSKIAKSLKLLEYRGYDSVGVAAMLDDKIDVRKGKGKVDEVLNKINIGEMKGNVFIGHTRWATHGIPNDINAHPHIDCDGKVAIVHNGTIKNFIELKQELIEKGHKFRSDTDSEVIAHLIEDNLKQNKDYFQAFKESIRRLEGSYAVIALISPLSAIFFAKRDNPLVIGIGEGENYIASDIPAFLNYTKRAKIIKDYEIGYITKDKVYIEDLNGKEVERKEMVINWNSIEISKGNYEDFMLKEIFDSPIAVKDTINGLLSEKDELNKAIQMIKNGRVVVLGAGTSYNAGLFFSILLNRAGLNALPMISSEYYNIKVSSNDVIFAISQSGETLDTLLAIKHFKRQGAKIISLVNTIGSAIDRESDLALYTRAGPEIGVAATKTFTAQISALSLLNSLITNEKFNENLHIVVRDSILKNLHIAKQIGTEISSARDLYCIGRGLSYPLARELALKIKEIAYIHAEAYPAGESKHGPIALVERGFNVFSIDVEGNDLIKNNIAEMEARGGRVFSLDDESLSLMPPLYLSVIPVIQLIAYYAAKRKGLDPDKPRNLAKTVTVE